jgi:hypothetical protein
VPGKTDLFINIAQKKKQNSSGTLMKRGLTYSEKCPEDFAFKKYLYNMVS